MCSSRDSQIPQTWNEQRTEALGLALNKMLYPLFEQELVQKLKEEATNHYLQVLLLKWLVLDIKRCQIFIKIQI